MKTWIVSSLDEKTIQGEETIQGGEIIQGRKLHKEVRYMFLFWNPGLKSPDDLCCNIQCLGESLKMKSKRAKQFTFPCKHLNHRTKLVHNINPKQNLLSYFGLIGGRMTKIDLCSYTTPAHNRVRVWASTNGRSQGTQNYSWTSTLSRYV